MTFTIDKRLLCYLIIGFVLATVIGTLSHECGHYVAIRLMGFKARINYGMTLFLDSAKMSNRQVFWAILAGPLLTMLTGSVGLLLLYKIRKSFGKLSFKQWFLIFISLFWLRQPANLVGEIVTYFTTGHYGEMADEAKISRYFNWSPWYIDVVTAFIGLFVLTMIIFKFIPKTQRLTFILSGLIGGISGFMLWLVYFGKVIMP